MTETVPSPNDRADLTANIVAAYLTNHRVMQGEVGPLISLVHAALGNLGRSKPEPAVDLPKPAVAIKKSITPDYLISLEDGRHYKSLKRHLSARGMTPAEYRDKWDLPSTYPMVAANYAKQRSELAKTIGLGRKPAAPPPPPVKAQAPKAKAARGRPAKAKV